MPNILILLSRGRGQGPAARMTDVSVSVYSFCREATDANFTNKEKSPNCMLLHMNTNKKKRKLLKSEWSVM